MKRKLSTLAAGLAGALAIGLCHAQQPGPAPGPAPGERLLPALTVRSADGQSIELATLDAGARSVLIVLDASMPSAREFLSALNAKGQELDQRIKILVLGDDDAVVRLKSRLPTLRGGTWLQAADRRAIGELRLPGIPCMLGLQGGGKVAWQFSGIQARPERIFFMARDWLQVAPDAMARAGQKNKR